MFRSSIRIHWCVPYERPNLPAISEVVFHFSSLTILQIFSTFLSVQSMERWHEHSQSSTEVSPHLNGDNHSSLCSPHGIVTERCSEHSMCFRCSFPEFDAKHNTNALFPQNQPLENHRLHFTCTTINILWEATQRVMVAKLSRLTRMILILWHLVAESFTTSHSQS
jgi:hypothetical protein